MSSSRHDYADKIQGIFGRLVITSELGGLDVNLVQTHLSSCSSRDPTISFN